MGYCTQDDILEQLDEATLIQLTDDEGIGSVDADKVTRAIADADAEIDSYCGGKYEVPFDTTPNVIRRESVDIAIYHLYSRRDDAIPDNRKERYDGAIKFLKDVAKGEATLGVQPPPDAPASGEYTGASQVSARTKVFDSDTMDTY